MITLKTLNKSTRQQVFDQVAKHLLEQNVRSATQVTCRYHHGPLRCAAGCLIADDEYDRKIEMKTWRDLVETNYAPKKHLKLIRELQEIHDDLVVKLWRDALAELADKYRLKKSVLA
jgi:hypothetical protein